MLKRTNCFADVKDSVSTIMKSESSFYLKTREEMEENKDTLFDVASYSGYGLFSAGSRLGFPATFMTKHSARHGDTTSQIMRDCYTDFFNKAEKAESARSTKSLLVRRFDDSEGQRKIYGVLSDKYSIFDDGEVINLLEKSDYLMDAEEFWYDVSPERFHARFVSRETLDIDGDNSPLHFCIFVDNSMVGESSLRVRFGLYRWACTNGCIFGFKEFEIVKERHKGTKEYEKILISALAECREYEAMIRDMVENMSVTKSEIYGLNDAVAISYLHDKLKVDIKGCKKIIELYNNTYGGETKWDLCNAITEFSHDVTNISERTRLERLATQVA